MNKFQKQKSREIKALMKIDKFGRVTYRQARRAWSFNVRYNFFYPCEDCGRVHCEKPFTVIAYCKDRR